MGEFGKWVIAGIGLALGFTLFMIVIALLKSAPIWPG